MRKNHSTIRAGLLIALTAHSLAGSAQPRTTGTPHSLAWVREYVGKSSNDLVGDKRFLPSLRGALPSMPPLPNERNPAEAAVDFMAHGQGPILDLGSSIVVDGCLPRACDVAGGWMWIKTDAPQKTKSPAMMLALLEPHGGRPAAQLPFTLVLIGQGSRPDLSMPEAAQHSLAAWLKTMNAVNILDFKIENATGKHKAKVPDYLSVR